MAPFGLGWGTGLLWGTQEPEGSRRSLGPGIREEDAPISGWCEKTSVWALNIYPVGPAQRHMLAVDLHWSVTSVHQGHSHACVLEASPPTQANHEAPLFGTVTSVAPPAPHCEGGQLLVGSEPPGSQLQC